MTDTTNMDGGLRATPGPWSVEPHMSRGDLPRPWVGRLEENRFAALACGDTGEEASANAHLIAAAPDMYAALESAIGAMEVLGHPKDYGALAKAKRVLAKARGES